jgi:hypothetical protein
MSEAEAQAFEKACWAKWFVHVAECTRECRTRGIDCAEAVELRRQMREASGKDT